MQIHKTESGYSHPEDLVPISEGNGGFIQIIGTKICANPTTVTGIARRFHTIIRNAQIYLIDFGCLEASESVTGWSCHGNEQNEAQGIVFTFGSGANQADVNYLCSSLIS